MKRLMYIITFSAMAVLVFAAIAVAQSVPVAQEPNQNTTSVQNSTTVPATTPVPATTTVTTTVPATTPAQTTTTVPATTPAPNSEITVDISSHGFDPAQLNVAPGTTVRFRNNDTESHTATADNGLFDTKLLEPGYSFEVLLEGSGAVTYHCELHPDMQGSIVVAEAGEAGGTEVTNPPYQPVGVSP
jgi:plastocyanin